MNWGTVVGYDLSLGVEGDVNVPKVFTPPVTKMLLKIITKSHSVEEYIRSHNKDLVAVLIQLDRRVFAFGSFHITEESVRVTTNDQVNSLGLLRQLNVLIVANVSQGNDSGNIFFCLDEVNGSLESCYRILEMGSITRIRDVGGGCGGHRKHSEAVVFENNVRNQGIAESFIVGMDVAGSDWECKVFELMRTNQSAPIFFIPDIKVLCLRMQQEHHLRRQTHGFRQS